MNVRKNTLAALTALTLAFSCIAPVAAVYAEDTDEITEGIVTAEAVPEETTPAETAAAPGAPEATPTDAADINEDITEDNIIEEILAAESDSAVELFAETSLTDMATTDSDGNVTITLTDDVTLSNNYQVNEKTSTIDLNGHTLDMTTYGIRIQNGNLIIKDTSTAQDGVVKSSGGQTIFCMGTDTVTIESGTVLNETENFGADSGVNQKLVYAINAVGGSDSNANVTVTGGTVQTVATNEKMSINAYAINAGAGSVEVSGGTVTASATTTGSGITAHAGAINSGSGDVAVSGGELTASATASAASASVYTISSSSGTVTVSGGTVSGSAEYTENGGSGNAKAYGMYVSAGTVNVTGGDISVTSSSTTSASNYGIWLRSGVINVKGGMITVKDETSTSGIAVGIYVGYSGSTEAIEENIKNADVSVTSSADSSSMSCYALYYYMGSENTAAANISGNSFTAVNSNGSGTAKAIDTVAYGNLTITVSGGTYSSDISTVGSVVTPNNYVIEDSENPGTYILTRSASTVYDTASAAEYSVSLDGLWSNLVSAGTINPKGADATEYKVVLTDIDSKYADVVATLEPSPTVSPATEYIKFDVSVEKYVDGEKDSVYTYAPATAAPQSVTVTLPVPASDVKVYHITSETNYEEITPVSFTSGDYNVTFSTTSFSPYIVAFTPATLGTEDYADKVYLELDESATGVGGMYNLKIYGVKTSGVTETSAPIQNFTSAKLKFVFNSADSAGNSYDITKISALTIDALSGTSVSYGGNGEYTITLVSNVFTGGTTTAQTINLGTVNISGEGTYSLSLNTSSTFVNTVTAEETFTYTNGTVIPETAAVTGTASPKTAELTINVLFPNEIKSNAAHVAMTVTVSGTGVDEPEITLSGETSSISAGVGTYSGYTKEVSVYQDYTYTVTFKGAGYRTYTTTVRPTSGTASVTVWNNVMENEQTVVTLGDTDSKTANVTFLAGDIYMDGVISIYDLSAAISYFGNSLTDENYGTYIYYDLNRDGEIDSKDIAMVLASWGK